MSNLEIAMSACAAVVVLVGSYICIARWGYCRGIRDGYQFARRGLTWHKSQRVAHVLDQAGLIKTRPIYQNVVEVGDDEETLITTPRLADDSNHPV